MEYKHRFLAAVAAFFLAPLTGRSQTITTFDVPGSAQTQPVSINSFAETTGNYQDGTGAHGFIRSSAGTFVTFDAPGSNNTQPLSISLSAPISPPSNVGFIRNAKGEITTFSVDAVTEPLSINSGGDVAGYYFVSGVAHGFIRTSK